MPFRPHQFRVLREFFDSLGARLRSIEEAISRSSEAISGIHDEAEAEKKIQQEISRQIPLLSVPKEEREQTNASHETRHRENRRTQGWIAGGTWFTGICTLAAFGAALYYAIQARNQSKTMERTYCEIRKQTEDADLTAKAAQDSLAQAQRQMHIDQRAWVWIKEPDPSTVEAGQPLGFVIRVSNDGKTAALGVIAKVRVELLPLDKAPSFIYERGKRGCWMLANYMFPSASKPESETCYDMDGVNRRHIVSIPESNLYASSDFYLAIHGFVEYDDVFGFHHWQKFCYMASGGKAEPLKKAARGPKDCASYDEIDPNIE